MKKLLGVLLLAGSSLFAAPGVFVGVGVGGYAGPAPVVAYAPPRPLVAYAPPAPGPGYAWVGGYWYPHRGRYAWRAGYWARPPYPRAYWVAPRYHGGHYYFGYWHR